MRCPRGRDSSKSPSTRKAVSVFLAPLPQVESDYLPISQAGVAGVPHPYGFKCLRLNNNDDVRTPGTALIYLRSQTFHLMPGPHLRTVRGKRGRASAWHCCTLIAMPRGSNRFGSRTKGRTRSGPTTSHGRAFRSKPVLFPPTLRTHATSFYELEWDAVSSLEWCVWNMFCRGRGSK